jgi:putative SOS response-associated peptidase YedK
MCGRYTLYHDEEDLTRLFELDAFPIVRRYNIAPTQSAPIVRERDGVRERLDARWGLVPHWVKDPATFKALLFNARSETAAEKPSFRDAMKRSRCAVPASGFFEWVRTEGSTQPYHIVRRDGAPMILAGLASQHPLSGATFTILTTVPNARVSELHDRMPVILPPEDLARWLDPAPLDPDALAELLRPIASDDVDAYPVGTAVGNARIDGPELVQRSA